MLQNIKKKCSIFTENHIHRYWVVYLCIWGSSYAIKELSHGKKVLKLPGDHTDFNLNLKTILLFLFDAQKSIYTKKKIIETSDFLFLFAPSDISVRHKIQGDKRIEIMS